MSPEYPDDCEEPKLNGTGCAPLNIAERRIGQVERRQDSSDSREGRFLAEVSIARKAVEEIREYYRETKTELSRINDYIFGPANAMLAKYSDPTELLDAAEEENLNTEVAARFPHLAERRIHKESRGRLEAEKRAEALGVEKERIRAAAELETKRVAEAARLAMLQIEREKRNAKLIHAAIGAIVTLAGVATTYLASRGH